MITKKCHILLSAKGLEEKIEWIKLARARIEREGLKIKFKKILIFAGVSKREYYAYFERKQRSIAKDYKLKDKIIEACRFFKLNCKLGSKKLSNFINKHKGIGYTSKFKIDKYKKLIRQRNDVFGYDENNNVLDLTPLYQKRRVRKANLSKSNKKNKMVAPCVYKSQPDIKNVLISDWTDISEIVLPFPLRLCPFHTEFKKILSMVISSKYTSYETNLGLNEALKYLKDPNAWYFHSDWGGHFLNDDTISILNRNHIKRSNTTSSMQYKFHSEGINALMKNEIIYNNTWSKTDAWGNYHKFISLLKNWMDEFNNSRIWLKDNKLNDSIAYKELKYYKSSKVLIPQTIIINVGDRHNLK